LPLTSSRNNKTLFCRALAGDLHCTSGVCTCPPTLAPVCSRRRQAMRVRNACHCAANLTGCPTTCFRQSPPAALLHISATAVVAVRWQALVLTPSHQTLGVSHQECETDFLSCADALATAGKRARRAYHHTSHVLTHGLLQSSQNACKRGAAAGLPVCMRMAVR
jgi:hypothetical protein